MDTKSNSWHVVPVVPGLEPKMLVANSTLSPETNVSKVRGADMRLNFL
jgi:hypothetical protein